MSSTGNKLNILIAYNAVASSPDPDTISEAAVMDEVAAVSRAVQELGHNAETFGVSDIAKDLARILKLKPNMIFNLCEGFRQASRHEMHIAALWELLDIPYSGSPPMALGLGQNKILAKRLFESRMIHTPEYQIYTKIPLDVSLEFPLIVKPACEDASLGLTQNSLVRDFSQLQDQVGRLLNKYRQPVLVERYIHGREFNISLLGNELPKVLPISEIDFSRLQSGMPWITSYEAKWLPDHPLYRKTPAICPARLDSHLKSRLEDIAIRVFRLLGGRDYGRVDTRVDDRGWIYVLEFNPNPDISPDAGYARAVRAADMGYTDFIRFILAEVQRRKPESARGNTKTFSPTATGNTL